MDNTIDLQYSDFLGKFAELGRSEWIVVYSSHRDSSEWATFYCALFSNERIEKSLSDPSWDLSIGHGLPGFSFHFESGKEIATYYRFSDEGIEPLVIWREFHGMKEGYFEISEEFRHYFNLYYDKVNNRFLKIDDNGDDEVVILMSDNEIKIKLRLIKEFLAVKKMWLALFFSIDRFSEKKIEELGIGEYHEHKKGDDYIYSIGARNIDFMTDKNKESQGWLLGKKLIPGLKDFKPALFGREEKRFVDFVIGIDEDGKEITYTCDEDKLANFFGKNQGSPYFLTPVLFRKEVLTKYYSQPQKYEVRDGYLSCGGLWSLHIDNDQPEHVMVYLGDLGHLSYKEQLYWKGFNVATKGKISHTAWKRGIKAEFANPESSDLFFKQKYTVFQEGWEKKFGWKFFRTPDKGDEHHFKALRIPLTNEQKEFDEQVLSLVKIFIDSLNEKEIEKGLSIIKENARGIDKLEEFLKAKGFIFTEMIQFLRNLQDLRSAGVAHLKGSKYEKIKKEFSIGQKSLSQVFDDILIKCIRTLNTLEDHLVTEKDKK